MESATKLIFTLTSKNHAINIILLLIYATDCVTAVLFLFCLKYCCYTKTKSN